MYRGLFAIESILNKKLAPLLMGGGGLFVFPLLVGTLAAGRGGALHKTAPPAGQTGGFGEPTCASCHTSYPVEGDSEMVSLSGIPSAFAAEETYIATLTLSDEFMSVGGFQLTARISYGDSAGVQAGVLVSLDSRVTVTDSAGVSYLQHTDFGTRPQGSGTIGWSFSWVAPRTSDPVVFHIAANSGNGDNSPLEDVIVTRTYEFEARETKELGRN